MNPASYALLLLAVSMLVPEAKNRERLENDKKTAKARPAWMVMATVFSTVFLFIAIGRLTVVLAVIIIVGTVAHS